MDLVSALIAKHFSSSGEELCIGARTISSIVSQYGTPLFIYDGDVLHRQWSLLRNTLPQEFSIYYSVKANPNCSILRYFIDKGCGLEIASGGEFHLAVDAGCSAKKIFFAGPGKTEAELEMVLAAGIGEIHIESALEVERISLLSRKLGKQARVAVRVNPGGEAEGGAMRMGGRPAPFGVDEESLDPVLERILSDSSLDFRGIHLFTGTQILDFKVLLRQYRKGLDLARSVARRITRPLATVDFGGGFGIPYFNNEHELDLVQWRTELATVMEEVRNDPWFVGTKFVVEPGRFLVGEAGIYVACVNDMKISRGKKFLVTDGGMNHHLAASGNLGQVIKRNFPVAILNKFNSPSQEIVDVVGPLCTPLDTLAREISLPVAQVGDFVGVFQSGAYARTASPLGFLSHPTPAEVLVQNGQVHLIRRRGSYEDLLRDVCQ